MRSTHKFLLLLLSIPSVFANCQNYQVLKEPDSKNRPSLEYPIEKMLFDKETKMMYALTSNDTHLVVHLRITDETLQQQIMMQGITIWFDTTGQKKELLGFKYPSRKPMPMNDFQNNGTSFNSNMPPKNQPNDPSMDQNFDPLNEIQLNGFSEKGSVDFASIPNKMNISAQLMLTEKGVLLYSGFFPLKYLGSLKKLSVGFIVEEFGGMNPPHKPAGMDGPESSGFSGNISPGGMGSGGGMPPGGGMRPGGGGGHRGSKASTPGDSQKTTLWIKNIKVN
ncbi:MAG: hypothetical protein M0P66_10525 [Salinivirgaceae bacterium]|nr:hypothetical protein [Salinivirgaceae bacterium]